MFLNALMLAGLGGAVLPIVLHLLARARYRTVDWGAMMFLAPAEARQHRSPRLRQLVLLAVRCGIVAVLATALARPVVRGGWAGLFGGGGGPVAAVLVLDCSASMAAADPRSGRTRIEAARDVATQVLAGLRRGDAVALLTPGRPGDDAAPVFSTDLQRTASDVAAASPGAAGLDVAATLDRAADVLDRAAVANADRRIYLITDQQAINWVGVDAGYLAAWRPRAGRGPVRVTVLPVGGAEAGNVAVESVWLAASPAVRGQASEAVARVRNHGPTAQVNVPLALLVDGRPVGSQTVTVPAGGATDVKFAVQFDAAGSHLLSAVAAVAGGGGVASDDRADAAVDAVEPVRVLVVSGDERADQPMRGESDFLRVALAPYAAARRPGPDPAAVTVAADASDWAGELARHQVLILANTAAPTDAPVRAIEQFAYDGGGVLIAPGSLASADAYNAALYRDGGGILPASLAAPTPADGSAATTVLGLDLADPLLQFLRGKPDPIPSATVGRHFPAAPRADARVLASYASGHPFAVAAAWGRGRVLLVTTPLDADWSTLPLSSFYLPFVQSAVRELTGPRAAERNVPPGRPLVYATDAPIDRAAATLALPDGTREALPVTQLGRRNEVRYAAAGQPGVYRLQFKSAGHDRTVHFVVQPPAGESDLTPLTDERWRQVEDALPMARVDVEREQVSRAVTGRRDGRELWGPLLVGVLALVAVETVLGRLWSGGD